jgi:hypothetical protein
VRTATGPRILGATRTRPARVRPGIAHLVDETKRGERGIALLVLLAMIASGVAAVVAVVLTLAILAYELA